MMQSALPSAGRRPRPTIWRNKPIRFVGLVSTMQPMSGQSKPSVSTMQLVTSSVFPVASRARMASRSWYRRRSVEMLGADAGAHELVAQVQGIGDVDRKGDAGSALAKFVPMGDDVADQLGVVHAVGLVAISRHVRRLAL